MKTISIILIFLFVIFNTLAQAPHQQPKSVTIDPNAPNLQDVKGNIKVLGITESNSVKVNQLATGNPLVAKPIYADDQGYLITGYRVGYFSIPPVALRLSWDIYGGDLYVGPDFVVYDGNYLTFIQPSSYRELLAPLYIPHKSKLSSLKLAFFSNSNVERFLNGSIIKTSIIESTIGTSIFNFSTPVSINGAFITVDLPIDLIEIDSQNYVYTLKLESSTDDWTHVSIKGIIIEYRDF